MTVNTISTVLVPASSYDLTDLASVHLELNIPTSTTKDDTFINGAITQVSKQIARYCNRVFAAETVLDTIFPERDWFPAQVPGGLTTLQLSRAPLVAPVTLAAGGAVSSGNVIPFASTTGIAVGQPVGHAAVPVGATVEAVSENASVTLTMNVTGTIASNDPVAFGIAAAIFDNSPTAPTNLALGADFRADAARGWLTRMSAFTNYPALWYPVQTVVAYQAGYGSVPEDLADAARRLVTARFWGRGRDPTLKSQTQPGLGDQSYWVGSVPGVKGPFPEDILGLIDPYRLRVIA